MLATAHATTLVGLDAHPVRVEVESARGPSDFILVGLAEASVRESRVRVRSALYQMGVDLGEYLIVVNLAPADVFYEVRPISAISLMDPRAAGCDRGNGSRRSRDDRSSTSLLDGERNTVPVQVSPHLL
jgi:hypothetical protein